MPQLIKIWRTKKKTKTNENHYNDTILTAKPTHKHISTHKRTQAHIGRHIEHTHNATINSSRHCVQLNVHQVHCDHRDRLYEQFIRLFLLLLLSAASSSSSFLLRSTTRAECAISAVYIIRFICVISIRFFFYSLFLSFYTFPTFCVFVINVDSFFLLHMKKKKLIIIIRLSFEILARRYNKFDL